MNDDWRLQVDLHDQRDGQILVERLDAEQLDHELSKRYHDRVVVSRNGTRLFLYAATRKQAEEVRTTLERDARRHGWAADTDFRRWHPMAEEWEDPDKPLPNSTSAEVAERDTLMAREREETITRGYPEFEVRVDLPSRHEAVNLTEKLRGEGLPAVRRWRYLLVGATDEDTAQALAKRLRREAPKGSQIKVEGTWAAVVGERSINPFAVLSQTSGT